MRYVFTICLLRWVRSVAPRDDDTAVCRMYGVTMKARASTWRAFGLFDLSFKAEAENPEPRKPESKTLPLSSLNLGPFGGPEKEEGRHPYQK